MLWIMTTLQPQHRVCVRNKEGNVVSCKNETWDPNNAQIPCEKLPPKYSQCITHSFDKFSGEFEPNTLPKDGCPNGRKSEYSIGIAICHPNPGVYCIGEQYWINTSYPCFEEGAYSALVGILLSFFVGCFGADRFYLGYIFLGFIKLLTFGGLLLWWIIDFILLVTGHWGPIEGGYSFRF